MAEPLCRTVACAFDNTLHGANRAGLKVASHIHGRTMDPTNGVIEAGDNIVSTRTLCGGAYTRSPTACLGRASR